MGENIDEKEAEKREEKEDEKQQQDVVSGIVGAAFLIWLGVVLLAVNMDFLNVFTNILDSLSIRAYDLPFEFPFLSLRAVQVFVLGGALILLVEIVIRLLVPIYRRRVLGTFIGIIALIAIGLGQWEIVGPLILVAIGISILFRGLVRRR